MVSRCGNSVMATDAKNNHKKLWNSIVSCVKNNSRTVEADESVSSTSWKGCESIGVNGENYLSKGACLTKSDRLITKSGVMANACKNSNTRHTRRQTSSRLTLLSTTLMTGAALTNRKNDKNMVIKCPKAENIVSDRSRLTKHSTKSNFVRGQLKAVTTPRTLPLRVVRNHDVYQNRV
jgi:hypothetical protein